MEENQTPPEDGQESSASEAQPSTLDLIRDGLRAYAASPAFIPSLAVAAALGICFWRLWMPLYNLWTSADGYYSHGFLVPVLSGIVVYKSWPKIKDIEIKPFWLAAIPLLVCLWMVKVGSFMVIEGVMSAALIGVLLSGVWMLAGVRWMLALSPAILYLAFGLPLWNSIINDYTNPLQMASTSAAYEILNATGFAPFKSASEPTFIYLNSYTLNVAVPCSGLKLLVALTALSTFIVLIGKMKTWANIAMIALIVPLGLIINGLRIALIGMVGDYNGAEAANKFHDWSGWITLVVCFIILSRIARLLGWQD
jgi:exosortase